MTDDNDLVKRLRKRQEFEFIDGYKRIEWEDDDALKAADRIEALEAKLAKAVEALRYYAVEALPWDADDSLIARTTLAEIEGEK